MCVLIGAGLKLGLAFWSCALLMDPVYVARVGVGTPSLGVTFDHLPRQIIGFF